MKFDFIAKHRSIWPVAWLCTALDVSRSGFHAWLTRAPSQRSRQDEEIGAKVRASFITSSRTYGARRIKNMDVAALVQGAHQRMRAGNWRAQLSGKLGQREPPACECKYLEHIERAHRRLHRIVL